jgi:hypothetical protein
MPKGTDALFHLACFESRIDAKLETANEKKELGSYGKEHYDLCRHIGHGPVA